jgi:LPXTG-motif cell wall-anchored protein
VKPSGALGTAGGRAATCNPDQADDHTVWKTPIAADGAFSVQLKVEASFGSTDCRKAACGVFVRKDHVGGATDFSQDAWTPIAFAAAGATAPSTTAAPTTTSTLATRAGTGAAAAPDPSAEVAGEQLATTGTSPTLALVGVGALAAGGALVVAGRRRRTV